MLRAALSPASLTGNQRFCRNRSLSRSISQFTTERGRCRGSRWRGAAKACSRQRAGPPASDCISRIVAAASAIRNSPASTASSLIARSANPDDGCRSRRDGCVCVRCRPALHRRDAGGPREGRRGHARFPRDRAPAKFAWRSRWRWRQSPQAWQKSSTDRPWLQAIRPADR